MIIAVGEYFERFAAIDLIPPRIFPTDNLLDSASWNNVASHRRDGKV